MIPAREGGMAPATAAGGARIAAATASAIGGAAVPPAAALAGEAAESGMAPPTGAACWLEGLLPLVGGILGSFAQQLIMQPQ